jgi:hypothetical protein
MYFGCHVMCPLFLTDFKRIWIDFYKCSQSQTSWISIHWKRHGNMRKDERTDGHDEATGAS